MKLKSSSSIFGFHVFPIISYNKIIWSGFSLSLQYKTIQDIIEKQLEIFQICMNFIELVDTSEVTIIISYTEEIRNDNINLNDLHHIFTKYLSLEYSFLRIFPKDFNSPFHLKLQMIHTSYKSKLKSCKYCKYSSSYIKKDVYTREKSDSLSISSLGLTSHKVFGVDNTGNIRVWASESILLHYLLSPQMINQLDGQDILELGSGMTGLCGLGLSMNSKCKNIVITDGHPNCVENIRVCIQMNKQYYHDDITNNKLQTHLLRWNDIYMSNDLLRLSQSTNLRQFNIVILSDCLFFTEFHDNLIILIDKVLTSNGKAYLMQPRRGNTLNRFLNKAKSTFGIEMIENYNEDITQQRNQYLQEQNQSYNDDIHFPILLILSKRNMHPCSTSISSLILPDWKIHELHVYHSTGMFTRSNDHMTDGIGNGNGIGNTNTKAAAANTNAKANDNDMDSGEVQLHYYHHDTVHTMKRSISDTIHSTLNRMYNTLDKKSKKSKLKTCEKKKLAMTSSIQKEMNIEANNTCFQVTLNDEDVDITTLTNVMWKDNMKITMFLSNNEIIQYQVIINPPCIASFVTFPRRVLLPRYLIHPVGEGIHMDCDKTTFLWYRKSTTSNLDDYEYVSNIKCYIPQEEDIGYKLKVIATPHRYDKESNILISGRSVVFYINGIVQNQLVHPKILSCRDSSMMSDPDHVHDKGIPREQKSKLRVVTFNILSDTYATNDYSINHLYQYCSKSFLDVEYRYLLILKELLSYDADIIALQECDLKPFEQYLQPILMTYGYLSYYTNKSTNVTEGCATFIQSKRLQVYRQFDIPLKTYLRSASYLIPLYHQYHEIQELIGGKLGMIVQIVICHWNDKVLLISNTHLFYHPKAAYIRLLQTHTILNLLEEMKELIQRHGIGFPFTLPLYAYERIEPICTSGSTNTNANTNTIYKDKDIGIIFMGDLNSTIETAVIEYLEHQSIDSSHEVWDSVETFSWRRREEEPPMSSIGLDKLDISSDSKLRQVVDNRIFPNLKHSFKLYSAARYPQYTNFTCGFKDLLDYIYVESDRWETIYIAPFPSYEDLIEHIALPNEFYPSDHLAVVVDIIWKDND